MPRVAINIVTHNSGSMIDACLEAVYRQTYRDFCVTVIDNASEDDTLERLSRWQRPGLCVHCNEHNEYFSVPHNRAIRCSDAEIVLTLNHDVMMLPNYLAEIVPIFQTSPQIGSVNGKLLLLEPGALRAEVLDHEPSSSALIDGAGLTMFPSRRPFLRGNRQLSRLHCLEPQYIFGVDAACGAYRRSMLEDVAVEGEYFDQDFVMYREDVDLAWRSQLFGWDSYYLPSAVGYHIRRFQLGRGRRSIPVVLKRHSVKNGWLMLVKNDDTLSILRNAPHVLPYQLKILGGLLTIEPSSIPAIPSAFGLLPVMLRKRAWIQSRRRRSRRDMHPWFH